MSHTITRRSAMWQDEGWIHLSEFRFGDESACPLADIVNFAPFVCVPYGPFLEFCQRMRPSANRRLSSKAAISAGTGRTRRRSCSSKSNPEPVDHQEHDPAHGARVRERQVNGCGGRQCQSSWGSGHYDGIRSQDTDSTAFRVWWHLGCSGGSGFRFVFRRLCGRT